MSESNSLFAYAEMGAGFRDIALLVPEIERLTSHPRAEWPFHRFRFKTPMSSSTRLITVRDAAASDMEAVQSIYAHEVLNGVATFEQEPPGVEEMTKRRQAVQSLGLPYLVAVENDTVSGYSYATGYRSRPAYRYTIESSVYVAAACQGQGIGGALLSALIARCEQGRWRLMIAVIGDSANAGSIALHKSLGFRSAGILVGSGFKHERWVDTVLMQRALGSGTDTRPTE